uniref:CSON007589 protein n=1 Tax=Culicoides sonorensis TaxID=179676 RepID=A0A336MZT4_CULSO
MNSKEIKTTLKEARELIKNKNFSEAIKKCQAVLKTDKDNYMSLILLGACYQDSNKEEATKFLKRALELSKDDDLLPLQGLASCAPAHDLPSVLLKLLKLQPEKCNEIHGKLLDVSSKLDDITELVQLLFQETKLNEKERVTTAWTTLVQILMNNVTIAEENFLEIFEQALAVTSKNTDIPKHLERNHRLISILHKKQKFSDLLAVAIDINEIHPRDTFVLEWLCKLYTDMPDLVEKEMQKPINFYANQLLDINPTSVIGFMAQSIYFYKSGDILSARNLALKVYEIEPKWTKCQLLLYDIYVQLGAFSSAEFIFNLNQNIIPVDLRIIKCLVKQNEKTKGERALILCKELLANEVSSAAKQLEILIWLTK